MLTSSHGNIFRVIGLLCGEFTDHRRVPLTKASDAELWCFPWSAPWINDRVNNREAGDLKCHRVETLSAILALYGGKPRSLVDLPRKGPVMWSIHIFSVVSLYMWLIEDNMTLKGHYCNEIFALAFAYRIVPNKTKNDINDNSDDDDDDDDNNNHYNFNVYISFKYSDSYFPFTFWRLLKEYHWNSGSEALFLHPGPWRGIFPASHVVTMRYIATSLIRRNCTGVLVLVACLHLTVNRGIWWYDATDGLYEDFGARSRNLRQG